LTSFTKSGLPTNGSTIFVRFFFKVAGIWSPGTDYTYTAFSDGGPPPDPGLDPEVTSPVPGSTLDGSSETFVWDPMGTVAQSYALWFGSGVGGDQFGRSGVIAGNQTSFLKTGLPTNGSTIFVRFFFKVAGIWSPGTDYTYTAAPPPPQPEIINPTPGSTLSSAIVTFTWDPMGTVAQSYALWFGSSVGTSNLGKSGVLSGAATSFTHSNLATDGNTLHVRLFHKVAGVWSSGTDYQYQTILNVTGTYPVAGSIAEGPCFGDPTVQSFAFTADTGLTQTSASSFQGTQVWKTLGGVPLAPAGVAIIGDYQGNPATGTGTFVLNAFQFGVFLFSITGNFNGTLNGLRLGVGFSGVSDPGTGSCQEMGSFAGNRISPFNTVSAALQAQGATSSAVQAQPNDIKNIFSLVRAHLQAQANF
jgi:hypothetical protein